MSNAVSNYAVSVVRINRSKKPGTFKAHVDVEVNFGNDVVQLKNFKVMDGENGLWAAAPSNPGKPNAETGKITYFNTLEFSQSLEYAIKDAIVSAYESDTVSKSLIPPKAKKTVLAAPTRIYVETSNNDSEDIPF